MLYNKDEKITGIYDHLRAPVSNEHLLKNKKKGQRILTRVGKKLR